MVKALATTFTLTRTPETSVSGQPVTIIGRATSGNTQPGDGTTTITVDGTDVKTSAGAAATYTITPLVGSVAIAARYSGDAAYAASTSGIIRHTVNKATPIVTAVPLYVTGVGQLAAFAVTVAPPFTGIPSGGVQLLEGTTALAAATVDASTHARLETSA